MPEKEVRFSEEVLLPREGESAAIAVKEKTAALCYERVWSPSDELIPKAVRCFGGSAQELRIVSMANDREKYMEEMGRRIKGVGVGENPLVGLQKLREAWEHKGIKSAQVHKGIGA